LLILDNLVKNQANGMISFARCYANAVFAVAKCPSVCLSWSSIVSKRLILSL